MRFITGIFARILYAVPFAVFGINHFRFAQTMKNYVPAYFHFRLFFVYFVGVALIAAAISIITKIWAELASLLLALMLLIFVLTIHIPGLSNPQSSQLTLTMLLKDTSLAGAALLLAGIFWREKRS